MKPSAEYFVERNQLLIEMRSTGATLKAIAAHFNISTTRVWDILKRAEARAE